MCGRGARLVSKLHLVDLAGFRAAFEHQQRALADRRQLADLEVFPANFLLFAVANEAFGWIERIKILGDDATVRVEFPNADMAGTLECGLVGVRQWALESEEQAVFGRRDSDRLKATVEMSPRRERRQQVLH